MQSQILMEVDDWLWERPKGQETEKKIGIETFSMQIVIVLVNHQAQSRD